MIRILGPLSLTVAAGLAFLAQGEESLLAPAPIPPLHPGGGPCCGPTGPIRLTLESLDGIDDPFGDGTQVGDSFLVRIAAAKEAAALGVRVECHPSAGLRLLSGALFFEDAGEGQELLFERASAEVQSLTVVAQAELVPGLGQGGIEVYGHPGEVALEGVVIDPLYESGISDVPLTLLVPTTVDEDQDGGQ